MEHRTIFELPAGGRFEVPEPDVPAIEPVDVIPGGYAREDLPYVDDRAEGEVVRHYTRLSRMNYAVDLGFYPLGSCTMKYNPKLGDVAASLSGFAGAHPYADEETLQGVLQLCYELEGYLCEICGMSAFTLWPAAGAHGELTGMILFRAYHDANGGARRTTVLIPDSAHGTNPASARMVGYDVRTVASTAEGLIDVAALDKALDDTVAGIMITNPNTLGLFERDILTISEKVHAAGGLLYYDGANLNAVMGRARPGDMGFDVVHLNVHKTFSTPHGGGGPGAGPVGVSERLVPYLPVPRVRKESDTYKLDYVSPESIGRVRSFLGNFGVLVRAYAYIRHLGAEGLKEASNAAVLNANYLRARVAKFLDVAGSAPCMHEFVATSEALGRGSALEIDKALIDAGFHPPTTYFPLIVKEALMIEPTETETKETLDAFAEALREIMGKLRENPEAYKDAPRHAPVRRLDEVSASRHPVLTWVMVEDE